LNLLPQFQDIQFFGNEGIQRRKLIPHRVQFEQPLPLLRIHPEIGRHEVDEMPGFVNVERRRDQFVRQVGHQRDQALKEVERVARQRLHFDRFLNRLRCALNPSQ